MPAAACGTSFPTFEELPTGALFGGLQLRGPGHDGKSGNDGGARAAVAEQTRTSKHAGD